MTEQQKTEQQETEQQKTEQQETEQQETEQQKTGQQKTEQQEFQIKIQTFRYTYSNEFSKELEYFSKIHRYDERKQFKEEWFKWTSQENIQKLIEKEKKTSKEQGYSGDIMDKMFKSARYYYRKKDNKNYEKEEKKKEDKQFMGLSKKMMKIMDEHINSTIEEHIDKTISKINPKEAFEYLWNASSIGPTTMVSASMKITLS